MNGLLRLEQLAAAKTNIETAKQALLAETVIDARQIGEAAKSLWLSPLILRPRSSSSIASQVGHSQFLVTTATLLGRQTGAFIRPHVTIQNM